MGKNNDLIGRPEAVKGVGTRNGDSGGPQNRPIPESERWRIMAKTKVSRKELLKEPDTVLTFSRRLFAFAYANRVQLLSGLGVLLALTLIVSGVQFYGERQEKRAFDGLRSGREQYQEALRDGAPAEAYQAVRSHFESLISEYGNKDGGKLARLVFADMALEADDFDAAAALYQEALADFGEESSLRNQALSGLAYAHEGKGEPEAAVEHFERIVAGNGAYLKSDALFQLGRLYEEQGQMEKSTETYERLLEEFPDFVYADLVQERLGRRS